MKQNILFIIMITILTTFTTVNANEAHDIMKKVDDNVRGQNIYMQMNMSITSRSHTRTMKMQVWAQGQKKSFVKTIYPPKDRGITFLSLSNQMWQYVPKIERIIKIPPSMMLQNWMGSDVTNDDMVKQSSLVEDYEPRIVKKEGTFITLELIPKEDAAVVWGKIISEVDTATYTTTKATFYDEEGDAVRVFTYKDVQKFGRYYTPMYWRITPSDKDGSFTEIVIKEVVYDSDISDKYFKKSALKRFSR
jgi:outer membrane lipoprotein-sorting protein